MRGHPSTKKCFRFRRLIISYPVTTSLFFRGTSNHLSERLTKCLDGRGFWPHKIHFWIRLLRDLMEHVSSKCKTWVCFYVHHSIQSCIMKSEGRFLPNLHIKCSRNTQVDKWMSYISPKLGLGICFLGQICFTSIDARNKTMIAQFIWSA